MTRKAALSALRIAGYHEDSKMFTRTYIENRVSYTAAKKEWNIGAQMKANGVVCECFDCRLSKGLI